MKEYPEIIRELREDHDFTQKKVADYLGTTQQVYSRYENKENEIPRRNLSRGFSAKVTNCSIIALAP